MIKHPRKIAFIHIPRTSGSLICQLVSQVNIPNYDPWPEHFRDWSLDELRELSNLKSGFIHSHSFHWTEDVFYLYKKKGWFTFTILRNPKDQLCSEYFFLREYKTDPWEYSGDLEGYLKGGRGYRRNKVPSYYKDISCIFDFNPPATFHNIMGMIFQNSYQTTSPVLPTTNKGFDFYFDQGSVTLETKLALEASKYNQAYLEARTLPNFFV